MSRRISLILSACLFICASCASPQPSARSSVERADDDLDRSKTPAQPASEDSAAPKDAPPARQEGPIDLGLGDANDPNAGPIVINRPNTSGDTTLDDTGNTADSDDAALTTQALQRFREACDDDENCKKAVDSLSCEAAPDCSEIAEFAPPDCDVQTACVENQCLLSCGSDGSDETGESRETDQIESPLPPDRAPPNQPTPDE